MHSHKRCPSSMMLLAPMASQQSFRSHSSHPSIHPHSVNRLEHLSFEVEASLKRSDVRYVLRVHHKATHTRWALSRSFDEYRAFQKRLLAVMRQGHFCQAECPWLYSFVASYFPKSSMFRSSSSRVVMHRQESLEKCMQQMHSYLLKSVNHSCSVTHAVADEFVKFVGADSVEAAIHEHEKSLSSNSPTKTGRASSDSVLSSTDDEEGEAHCAVCEKSFMDADATDCCYTTVLSCGHEFHDECILSKLNEDMSCPVCGHAEAA